MATIAVVHFAVPGHQGPAVRLSRVLSARGHRLIHFSPEGTRAEIEAAGAELRPMSDFVPAASEKGDQFALAVALAQATVALTPEVVDGLLEEEVDLVINDAQAPWGRVAAEWMGLPRVCSWPLFPPVPVAPGTVAREPDERQAAALAECRKAVGLRWGVELGTWHGGFGTIAECNLVFTTPEVAGTDPGPGWLFVGPLMDDHDATEPLVDPDDPRPLVYAALGTLSTDNAPLFRAVMAGLAGEPVRVLLSTWLRYSAADLAPVPDNAVVAPRVDSRGVLSRAAVHVTHSGASSAHESVIAGVPMLLVPQGSDQPLWAARFEALGVAERAGAETAEAIRAGVRRLLADAELRERTRALGRRLRDHDGPEAASRAVEALLETPARAG